MAATTIANQITAGQIDIGLAIGCESMSQFPDYRPAFSEGILAHPIARDCSMPMAWTSENVASDFNISREDMDALSALSFQRAEKAQKSGYFDNEIVPFTAFAKGPTGERTKVTVSRDDGIRYGTTKEALGKIRSAFPQWGKGATTGGNASQITDGAAAVILMRRSKAEELGLKIMSKYVTTAVVGLCLVICFCALRLTIFRSGAKYHGHWAGSGNTEGLGDDWNS
jgi:acetyl-CoA acyltransferase 1